MLFFSIMLTLFSASLLFWPNRKAQARQQRIEAGDDRYFEEQRSYRAYPWLGRPKRIRFAGAVGTACGLVVSLVQIFRPSMSAVGGKATFKD
jgi:hypothetical protein